jgi:hypothetical protein
MLGVWYKVEIKRKLSHSAIYLKGTSSAVIFSSTINISVREQHNCLLLSSRSNLRRKRHEHNLNVGI